MKDLEHTVDSMVEVATKNGYLDAVIDCARALEENGFVGVKLWLIHHKKWREHLPKKEEA